MCLHGQRQANDHGVEVDELCRQGRGTAHGNALRGEGIGNRSRGLEDQHTLGGAHGQRTGAHEAMRRHVTLELHGDRPGGYRQEVQRGGLSDRQHDPLLLVPGAAIGNEAARQR